MDTEERFRTPPSGKSWLIAAGALVVLILAVGFRSGEGPIATAPRFTAADLSQAAGGNWLTNGGSTTNQRFSSLSQINVSNVSQLKGVFRTHLVTEATGVLQNQQAGIARAGDAKYSGESQPLVYDGVIYISTGADDVFAVSSTTGAILWEYQAHLNQNITTVCCGWLNRGVAIGEGRVYLGQLDGKVVALNQLNGKVIWSKQLVSWRRGYTITGAPLYLDGRLYIGVVGSDFGIRGRLQALDAKSGREIWRFYTIPGPGQPGSNTWPTGSSVYLQGGASVWAAPAYDAKLGLLYITTGNAGDDAFGGHRPGKNLYACSIVAIDGKTGTERWYFQEVHHDLWDYDSPAPPVLFDVKSGGDTVPGIGAPGKTGWLYLLNRETGKPLYGIDEKPVPQSAAQKTWPTQPIPRTSAFVPHGTPTAAQVKRVESERTGPAAKVPVVIAKTMYTPPSTKSLLVYTPGSEGGNNWEPSSYSPETQMFYVCAVVAPTGVLSADLPYQPGQFYGGIGGIAGISIGTGTGTLTAISARTGKVVWQKHWAHPCYSGTVSTSGNLVFTGQDTGELQAYDARNGKLLWSFQTGAGANDTAAVFEQNGNEYLAFLSAGNSLAATPHGDSLWVFGLDGTLGPAPPPGKGIGTLHQEGGGTPTTGNAAAGKTVYQANCGTCHGSLGEGGNGGPSLQTIATAKDAAKVARQVTNGGGGMPAFNGQLTAQQIADVAAYVSQKIAR
jgi:alcohol dehydrogenase (cytochrome c)